MTDSLTLGIAVDPARAEAGARRVVAALRSIETRVDGMTTALSKANTAMSRIGGGAALDTLTRATASVVVGVDVMSAAMQRAERIEQAMQKSLFGLAQASDAQTRAAQAMAGAMDRIVERQQAWQRSMREAAHAARQQTIAQDALTASIAKTASVSQAVKHGVATPIGGTQARASDTTIKIGGVALQRIDRSLFDTGLGTARDKVIDLRNAITAATTDTKTLATTVAALPATSAAGPQRRAVSSSSQSAPLQAPTGFFAVEFQKPTSAGVDLQTDSIERLIKSMSKWKETTRQVATGNTSLLQTMKEVPPTVAAVEKAVNTPKAEGNPAEKTQESLDAYIKSVEAKARKIRLDQNLFGASSDQATRLQVEFDISEQLLKQNKTYESLSEAERKRLDDAAALAMRNADQERSLARQKGAWGIITDGLSKNFDGITTMLVNGLVKGQKEAIKLSTIVSNFKNTLLTSTIQLGMNAVTNFLGLSDKPDMLDLSNIIGGWNSETSYGGVSSLALAKAKNGATAGGSFSSNLLSLAGNLIPSSWIKSITSAIDGWGASALGIGVSSQMPTTVLTGSHGVLTGGGATSVIPGEVAAGTGLTSYLGPLGIGAGAGGLLGPMVANGNKVVGGVVGAASGAAAGAMAGMFLFPGVGPLIGALLGGGGGGLSGLLGTQKPSVGPTGQATVFGDIGGKVRFVGAAADNDGDAGPATVAAQAAVAAINAAYSVYGGKMAAGFGNNPGIIQQKGKFEATMGDGLSIGKYDSADEAAAAFAKAVLSRATDGLAPEIQTALRNTSAKTIQDLASDIDFGAKFKENYYAMKGGLDPVQGQDAAIKSAAKSNSDVWATFVTNFRTKSTELNLATKDEANGALRTMLDTVLGLGTTKTALTDVQVAYRTQIATIESLRAALTDVGGSADYASKKITEATESYKKEVKTNFDASLDMAINAVTGKQYLNDAAAVYSTYEANMRSAVEVGGDNEKVTTLFNISMQNIVDQNQLIGASFDALIAKYPGLLNNVHAYTSALQSLSAAQVKAASEDLGVRRLRAQGRDAEADAEELRHKQVREYAQAEKDGYDAVYLAALKSVQGLETQAVATQALKDQATAAASAMDTLVGTVITAAQSVLDANKSLALTPISASARAYQSLGGTVTGPRIAMLQAGIDPNERPGLTGKLVDYNDKALAGTLAATDLSGSIGDLTTMFNNGKLAPEQYGAMIDYVTGRFVASQKTMLETATEAASKATTKRQGLLSVRDTLGGGQRQFGQMMLDQGVDPTGFPALNAEMNGFLAAARAGTASADDYAQAALGLTARFDAGRLTVEQYNGLLGDLGTAYQAVTQKADATATAMKGLGTTIRNYLTDLQVSDKSPLDPAKQRDAAQVAFEDALAKAGAGDENAIGRLTGLADAFLTASRALNASGPNYASDYTAVTSQLGAFAGQIEKAETPAQKTATATALSADMLGKLNTAIGDARTDQIGALGRIKSAQDLLVSGQTALKGVLANDVTSALNRLATTTENPISKPIVQAVDALKSGVLPYLQLLTTANTNTPTALQKAVFGASSQLATGTGSDPNLMLDINGSSISQARRNAIATALGYTGAFGGGALTAYMASNADWAAQFLAAVKLAANPGAGILSGAIPGFATGTPDAPPGLAWVGERGPELMRLRGGEAIYPHDVSMDMARSWQAPANDRWSGVAEIRSPRPSAGGDGGSAALVTALREEIRGLRDELRSLKAITAQGHIGTKQAIETGNDYAAEMAQEARLRKAAPRAASR